jgi:hypothetical protein
MMMMILFGRKKKVMWDLTRIKMNRKQWQPQQPLTNFRFNIEKTHRINYYHEIYNLIILFLQFQNQSNKWSFTCPSLFLSLNVHLSTFNIYKNSLNHAVVIITTTAVDDDDDHDDEIRSLFLTHSHYFPLYENHFHILLHCVHIPFY